MKTLSIMAVLLLATIGLNAKNRATTLSFNDGGSGSHGLALNYEGGHVGNGVTLNYAGGSERDGLAVNDQGGEGNRPGPTMTKTSSFDVFDGVRVDIPEPMISAFRKGAQSVPLHFDHANLLI